MRRWARAGGRAGGGVRGGRALARPHLDRAALLGLDLLEERAQLDVALAVLLRGPRRVEGARVLRVVGLGQLIDHLAQLLVELVLLERLSLIHI